MNTQNKNTENKMYQCKNPYSGVVSIMNQEQVDAFKKIKTLEYEINVVNADNFEEADKVYKMIDEFDELRYEFAEKWSNIYMEQLD